MYEAIHWTAGLQGYNMAIVLYIWQQGWDDWAVGPL